MNRVDPIAALLVVVALVIGVTVLLAGRKQRPPVRGAAASWFTSLLWALPVVAVLAFVCVQVSPRFHGALKSVAAPAETVSPVGWSKSSPAGPGHSGHGDSEVSELPTRAPTPADSVDAKTPAETPLPGPAWIREPRKDEGEATLVVVESGPKLDAEEAETDALAQATALLREDFHAAYAEDVAWSFPVAVVREHAVRNRYIEPVTHTFRIQGEMKPTAMYVAHLQVELSPRVRGVLFPYWRDRVVSQRLWVLGGLVGLLTLITGTLAAYFRLDTLSGGAYRNRLKFAAVSLIVSGGLLLAMIA